ncbi:MAG: class II aldolase/adducin family protein [Acidimicrobiaceae bacterium]|jgi:ribulose-5-phosphate 4-epimerase/fuculose-1-phosphate aldolase|nr:class II aldolase/adducin family protein [Acidimicrobiaceae bacterium]
MDVEQIARRDLAVAFRWAARLNMHEATANHFSVAVSPDSQNFLINPAGRHFSQVRASDLVLVNANDAKSSANVDPTAINLHGQIHKLLPHAKCILHTHMPYTTALACLRNFEFLMLDQNACRFYQRIAYDRDYFGMALAASEGERVALVLGESKNVLFLANHGVIVVSNSVAEAFDELYYLEKAAQLQVLALSTGRELAIIDDETASLVCKQWLEYPKSAEHHFAALIEILDQESPEYKN